MSWLSNHGLNAMLTGMSELHRFKRCCENPADACQDATCLNMLMQDQSSWGGVFAADALPPPSTRETCYIVNSAPSSSKGEHWLAIRLLPDAIEFFDSYGQPPCHYTLLSMWLQDAMKQQPRRRLLYYRQRIQGPHAYCGAYCFYFLCERPYVRSFYATLFENPRFVFTSLEPSVTETALIKRYLSFNDAMVFDYLHRHAQHLLSMFTTQQK